MANVVVTREAILDAPIEVIWRVVTDTNRLNEAMGYDRLQVQPSSGPSAARFHIKTKMGGLATEFEEFPFEWVEHERQVVHRVMKSGSLKTFDMVTTLAPAEKGTKVTVVVTVAPRSWWLGGIIKVLTEKAMTRWMELVAQMMASAMTAQSPSEVAGGRRYKPVSTSLERAGQALRERVTPAQRGAADRLLDLVAKGGDADLARIRPFELADAWGVDRRDMTTVCLNAVVAGLLELTWDLVCPSCQTATDHFDSLEELASHGSCQLCDLNFGLDFDRAIEVTFRPVSAVRPINEGPFCISGGAAKTPHVMTQLILTPHGTQTIAAPSVPGRYRLFLRGGALTSVEVSDAGGAEARVDVTGDTLSPPSLIVAPRAPITIVHDAEDARHIKLERLDFANRAATASFINTLPTFRRMFSGEALRAGLSLRVARIAVLFSNLTGSTALYSKVGDALAYRVVSEHFDLLGTIIGEHKGAMVKTIGDAIMATFVDERDAVGAAMAMQQAYARFRSGNEHAEATELKLGLYAGPAFAVTANKVLDYFGQSVNLAARLQAKAEPGELVVPAELADRAEAEGWLVELKAAVVERFDAELKGIDGLTRAARIALTG